MNPEKTPELTVQALMALRKESDAVRVITEKLKVKEMGPADHIRTKHEAKAFVASADLAAAETLLLNARVRRSQAQSLAEKVSLRQRRDIRQ